MAIGDMPRPDPSYPPLYDMIARYLERITLLEGILDKRVPGWRELDEAKRLQECMQVVVGNVSLGSDPMPSDGGKR